MVTTRAGAKAVASPQKSPPPSTKKKVPRKKLQNVNELLAGGDEDSTWAESATSKIIWMTCLIIMFYLSFELFIRMMAEEDTADGSSSSGRIGESAPSEF